MRVRIAPSRQKPRHLAKPFQSGPVARPAAFANQARHGPRHLSNPRRAPSARDLEAISEPAADTSRVASSAAKTHQFPRPLGEGPGVRAGGCADTLAAAYAENGDFAKAREWQEKAIDLADEEGKTDGRARLELYKQGKPYRMEAKSP